MGVPYFASLNPSVNFFEKSDPSLNKCVKSMGKAVKVRIGP